MKVVVKRMIINIGPTRKPLKTKHLQSPDNCGVILAGIAVSGIPAHLKCLGMSSEIIEKYGHLVYEAVRQIDSYNLPVLIDRDDLIQEGFLVLIRCAQRFKDTGQAKFSTYADKCIRPHLKKVIVESRWGPPSSTYWKQRKEGVLPLDMVSYDSFARPDGEDEESSWIDNVASEPPEAAKEDNILFTVTPNERAHFGYKLSQIMQRGSVRKNGNKFDIAFLINGKRVVLCGFDSEDAIKKWRGYGFENIIGMIKIDRSMPVKKASSIQRRRA